MKRTTIVTAAALALTAALSSPLALGASGSVMGYVTRVLVVSNDTFGGCMALLSVDPQTVLTDCQKNWVTFSCTGTFTDPVRAYRMLDQAQLALVANKRVWVQVVDTSTHNGYCFANRIDVIK